MTKTVLAFSFMFLTVGGFSAQASKSDPYAIQTAIHYPTVALKPDKAAADVRKGVQYLSADEREQLRIVIIDGLVFAADGKPIRNTIEPKNDQNADYVNYVMDAAGNFYLFDEYATPKIRHSSILAGGPVAGAGEIKIENQQIVDIDANSGHYASAGLMKNVLAELRLHGVKLKN